jgi:cell wall assembly regulator SMI1
VVGEAAAEALPPPVRDIEDVLHERLAAALPQQRELLRRELATWLDEQLPQLVMRVLDGVSDQLVAQINTQARMTLLPKLQAALEAHDETPPGD